MGRAGFTLVEALISLVLSSFVILMVSSTFLVQNGYYSAQVLRTGAHDNVRVATELVASEVRSMMGGGFVVAGHQTLTLRSPLVVGVICSRSGTSAWDVLTDGGQDAIDTDEVAGAAFRDRVTKIWFYGNTSWAALDAADGLSATACYANGADTVGASGDFHRLTNLTAVIGPTPSEGDLVMLFRETTFKIQTSELDPTSLGLFRGVYGGALVEFATGIDSTSGFQYAFGGGSYADTITGGDVGAIDAVRLVLQGRKPAQTGGRDDITFGWSVDVPVRNVR